MNFICPNINDPMWQKLIDHFKGDEAKAFKVWKQNDYSYPDNIFEESQEDDIVEETLENPTTVSDLEQDQILKKAINTLKLKYKSVSRAANKHQHLNVIVAEMNKLIKDLENYQSDTALHKFILGAEKMVNSSLKWLEKVDTDNVKLDAITLQRVYDSVASFSIIKDIQEGYFKEDLQKKDFKKIAEISSKIDTIHNQYISIAREYLADTITPHFTKIKSSYIEKAEREYINNIRAKDKANGLSKEDMKKSKESFIFKYITAHKEEIERETEKYVKEMLIQTSDISSLIRYVESPKDMNHSIMDYAVKVVETADRDIRLKTINKTYELDELHTKFLNQVGRQNDPKKQYESILAKDADGNILPIIVNPDSHNWDDFNNKHQNDAVRDLYDKLTEIIDEKTKLVGKRRSLYYKLPNINKSMYERVMSEGGLQSLKEGFFDHFKIRSSDTQFGSVEEKDLKDPIKLNTVFANVNQRGIEREDIPLFYRYPIEESDRSYDVLTSILLDYNNSLQYSSRLENGVILQMLKDVIMEADIHSRVPGSKKLKVHKDTEDPITKSAEDSNLVAALNSLIRHRVYGIATEGDPRVAKVMSQIKKYTSLIALGGNVLTGTANYLQGQTLGVIEAIGNKKGRFSIKNRMNASIAFDKDMINILKDVNNTTVESHTNQLMQYFNVLSDYSTHNTPFINNSALKRILNKGSLTFANHMAIYSTQAITMYARLDNIKVFNSEGKYLDKNFEPTEDRDAAIGIDKAIISWKNGNPIFHESVNKTEITNNISTEELAKVEFDMRRIIRDLFGNDDIRNKSESQKHAVLSLVHQMRNWIIPGIQKRYKSIGTLKTKTKDLDIDQRNYNEETQEFEEGTYTTAIKFLYHAIKEARQTKQFATIPANWNNLTDYEKSNIKQTAAELAFAFSALLLYGLLKGDDDDEDKDKLLAIYLARRLYSETIAFANINEALRTFRSPAMATNTAESIMDVVLQSLSPTEEYETGRHAGENKLLRKSSKLIPVWKQYNRSLSEALLFLEK